MFKYLPNLELNHVAIAQIHEAIVASPDGNVWIYLNAKYDYVRADIQFIKDSQNYLEDCYIQVNEADFTDADLVSKKKKL